MNLEQDIITFVYRKYGKHMRSTSISMSWCIYFEFMLWFGMLVPMYMKKWHLDLTFIKSFAKLYNINSFNFFPDVHNQMSELVEKNTLKSLLNPRHVYYVCRLLINSLQGTIGEVVY